MNQVTEEQKSATTKSLAIVGFIAAVIFIVWLVVQIVGVLPSAFSSLASIADSVYNYNDTPELNVSTRNSVVNSNDAFNISWEAPRQDGTFSFLYECEDGVAMNIRTAEGDIMELDCDTSYNLGTATNVEATIATERQRFTDVRYIVTFIPERESAESTSESRQITIVNVSIPTSSQLANGDDSEFTNPDEEEEVEEPETPTETETPVVTTPAPAEPTYVEEVVYAIPTSDPNGYTDLAVTYLGVGVIQNGVFVRSGTIKTDQKGAIQFMVKNLGTKTSENWSFTAELPSDISYDAPTQTALKPNEQAIYTLGFEGIGRTGVETFSIELDIDEDTKATNNDFTWAITVVN